MNQKQTILQHMIEHGTINPITSIKSYQIMRLAARICDLRKDHNIKTHTITKGKKSFAVYELIKS